MDKIVVGEKLNTLRDRIDRIDQWAPKRYEDFESNRDAEDIVVHNFCQATQVHKDCVSH